MLALATTNKRWCGSAEKRTFVRALEGTYGELQQGLMDWPGSGKSTDWQWKAALNSSISRSLIHSGPI